MKLFKYSLIVLISISLFSCEKDDDEASEIVPQTNTEKLCGKNFFVTDFEETKNGVIISTIDSLTACDLDDFERYETNGVYTYDEGATKCDPTNPQTETGTWTFYDSETKLFYDNDTSFIQNIIRNDGTVLILVHSYIDMGDTIETTFTYTARY
ncbi:hypothetical protein N9J85_00375 [bacterium]|nr:hypothetical protein [bacterium]